MLAVGGVIALAGAAVLASRPHPVPSAVRADAPAERPTLLLLTSLPVVFGETFSLDGGGSPALQRLEQRYAVRAIAVADRQSLDADRLLLMAHPRAQPAEVLVELDGWLRKGGRLVLLADPRLDWESSRPLGDPLRPPPAFADTGLLGHWGVALDGAMPGSTAGTLRATRPACTVTEAVIARCRVGKGQATIIADADFMMVDSTAGNPGLDLLMNELARLESL